VPYGIGLDGMRRWGCITIDGTAKKIHHGRPGPDAVLRATARGLRARQAWVPLSGVTTGSGGQPPPLFSCLRPYPDGWRARVRRPTTLPHYPMVLHRGGYADGG